MIQTPVAIFIFNRPHCTEQLVHALAEVRPANLFVIADGPRNASDIELCEQTRAVIYSIDWPCTILKLYATSNIGCRKSIPNGLNWVFEHVNTCIILEDDCIPKPSFFPYCEELLSRYKYEERIMTIGGHRSDGPNELGTESYYFSKYPSIWGWATWKEKWAKYDLSMSQWPELKNSKWLDDVLQTPKAVAYWSRMFDQMKNGLDTWDYALAYSCWLHKGLSIRSRVNMISNVGFGKDATHTHQTEIADIYANPVDIEFPLKYPTAISIDKELDDRIEWVSFSGMDERRLQVVRERIYKSRSHEGS
jgi:hypothetical protein